VIWAVKRNSSNVLIGKLCQGSIRVHLGESLASQTRIHVFGCYSINSNKYKSFLIKRYDTIVEFNVDSKAEYTA